MKKLIFFVAAFAVSFFACTADDERDGRNSDIYVEELRALAASCGYTYERTTSSPITEKEYKETVRMINFFKEQTHKNIVLDLVKIEEDGTLIYSNSPYGTKDVKTRAENALSSEASGVTITVRLSGTGTSFSIGYSVTSTVYDNLSLFVNSEEITRNGDVMKFSTQITVVADLGNGGYVHLLFKLDGSFNVKTGQGSLSCNPIR